jgi:ATPase subunit of ABC transporter with duplicated ATPase domains
VVIGTVDQARGAFLSRRSLLDLFTEASGLVPADARTLLAKFNLRSHEVLRPGASLSPGERTRAALALLQSHGVNLLILDEPTNHLDLPAIEQLEEALDTFPGTLLLVTHDRRMLGRVRTSRRLEVVDGRVTEC